MELTDKETKTIAFHLACRLEDFEKELRKRKIRPETNEVFVELEQFVYTRLIPESWCGPRPTYWK